MAHIDQYLSLKKGNPQIGLPDSWQQYSSTVPPYHQLKNIIYTKIYQLFSFTFINIHIMKSFNHDAASKFQRAKWQLDWFTRSAEAGKPHKIVLQIARHFATIALEHGTTGLKEEARQLITEIDAAAAKYL